LSERRSGSFLAYALGEIVLVVVGILIALQINNWNEERIEQRQVRAYALNLAADIQRDLAMIEPVDLQVQRLMRQAELLADYARQRPLEAFENAQLFFLTNGLSYRPFAWNRAAMDQLKNSGALRQIDNYTLVDRISAYDALTHHLDQDYTNDMNLINQLQLTVNRVVDLNYPEEREISAWIDTIPDENTVDGYLAFRDSELFARLAARELPLLTGDLGEVRFLVNQMLEVKNNVEARTTIELPRLRALADDIVRLIDAEYR